jgi:hypothetical protein
MALGSTEPLTELSTRNLPGGKGRPARNAWEPHGHLWADFLENMGASTACYRDSFTFSYYNIIYYSSKSK